MPRRREVVLRRARDVVTGQFVEAAFAFVNTGRATLYNVRFDSHVSPEQAAIRQTVSDLLGELYLAAARGENATPDWRARLCASFPPPPGTSSLPASTVVEFTRSITSRTAIDPYRLDAHLLRHTWETIFDSFLLNPKYEAFRLLERCRKCQAWFIQDDSRQTYCATRCRRMAAAESKRSPRKHSPQKN